MWHFLCLFYCRWTNFFYVLRRFCLGVVSGNVLPRALLNIKLQLKPSDTLEENLLKMIKADKNDFSAKNKLRLIRIVSNLAEGDVLPHLAVSVVTLFPVEAAQAALMGFERKRATLADIVHPCRSPVAIAQQSLLALATDFNCDDGPWRLLTMLGLDPGDAALRRLARRNVLQVSAGFTDVFELRLEGAPYRHGWLTFPEVDQNIKEQIVRDFFDLDPRCLSFFCLRLRQLYPNARQFLREAPPIIIAWLLSTSTGIDFSERCHAVMRQDIAKAGTGPAVNFVNVANRSLCRQFVNEHTRRGGRDPATLPLSDLEGVVISGQQDAARQSVRASRGSSAFLEFHAMRAQSYKAIFSPSEPLSEESRRHMEDSIQQDWARECADGETYDMWLRRMRSKRDDQRRQVLALAARGPVAGDEGADVAGSVPSFAGLFGRSQAPNSLLPAVEALEYMGDKKAREKVLNKEDDFFVRSAPQRKKHTKSGWGGIFGCLAYKKNACRKHCLAEDRVRALDGITQRLCKWC
jgi:hypothetical protein